MLYPEFCMNCKKILRIDDSRCVKCGQQVYEQYRKAVNVNGSNNSYEGEWFNDKINGDGDFYFQQESSLVFTITKPLRLASLTCSIHDPDGSYARVSEQSTVLFLCR